MFEVLNTLWLLFQWLVLSSVFLFVLVNIRKWYRSVIRGIRKGFVLIKERPWITKENFLDLLLRLIINYKQTLREELKLRRVYKQNQPTLFWLNTTVAVIALVIVYPAVLFLTGLFSFDFLILALANVFGFTVEGSLYWYLLTAHTAVLLITGIMAGHFLHAGKLKLHVKGIYLGFIYDEQKAEGARFMRKFTLNRRCIWWGDVLNIVITDHSLFEGFVELLIQTKTGTVYKSVIGERDLDEKRINKVKFEISKYISRDKQKS